jgi:alcohol dehydrogenase
VYSRKLSIPLQLFLAAIGDQRIVNTLCPGGKERMRRLMELVRNNRVPLKALLTHTFPLENIVKAYKYFEQRSDIVAKVAIKR